MIQANQLGGISHGKKHLIFRADANASIGSGHVMRCLALAQAWNDRGMRSLLITDSLSQNLQARLEGDQVEIIFLSCAPGTEEDADLTAATARKYDAAWVVVDGYQFGYIFQERIRQAGIPLLWIDDYGHADYYSAEIILNQNVYADERLYPSRDSHTTLLLGLKYVLLRREFAHVQHGGRTFPEVASKILVTVGGGDPRNITSRVIRALSGMGIGNLEIAVLIGEENPNVNYLRKMTESMPWVCLEERPERIPALMAWADAAIAGAGSTVWELIYTGTPFLSSVLARNQQLVAEYLEEMGLSMNLGDPDLLSDADLIAVFRNFLTSRSEREQYYLRSSGLIDGEGTSRVIMAMCHEPFRLRPVRWEDCEGIWKLANDRVVREASFHQEPISLTSHKQWFLGKIRDPHCRIYVAVDSEDRIAGQVRFDIRGEDAEIDISLAQRFRGSGYGPVLLEKALSLFIRENRIRRIHARVKEVNQPSMRTFEMVGFIQTGRENISGSNMIHYIWGSD